MFTREDTKAIKGAAIVLMLFHHLASSSARYPVGFGEFTSLWKGFVENGYLQRLAVSGNICVPIFFFLGGYGLYKRWESGKFKLSEAVISLYRQYWKVFVIFVPIAFLFFSRTGEGINSLAARYVIDSNTNFISALLSNFLGYTCTFNSEWWFFSAYLCTLPLGYLLLTAIRDHQSFLKDLFIAVLISILLCVVFPNLSNTAVFANINSNLFFSRLFLNPTYVCTFFEGIVFAKYDAVAALKRKVSTLPLKHILCLLGVAAVFWCRMFVESSPPADMIYVPFLIAFVSVLLEDLRMLGKLFSYLGKHSANMWYIHSFYCYYFLEVTKIVYSTKSVWIDLLILVALSLGSSVLLEFVYDRLGRLLSYVRARIGAGA